MIIGLIDSFSIFKNLCIIIIYIIYFYIFIIHNIIIFVNLKYKYIILLIF